MKIIPIFCYLLFFTLMLTSSNVSAQTDKIRCDEPSLFKDTVEKNRDDITNYLSEWYEYEDCMITRLAKMDNFESALVEFNELFRCAPDYETAFNELNTSLISEKSYYSNRSYCAERKVLKLDVLLNTVWAQIKRISGDNIPEFLLEQQRAWLNFYGKACHLEDDHPYSYYQYNYCTARELEFRVLSLSAYLGEDGDGGWPALNLNYLLNEMNIRYQ